MKAPICNICLKSDVLCSHCSTKLEEGKISDIEVKISRKLQDLSEDNPSLQDSEIVRVLEAENVVVVVADEGDGAKVVGRKGRVVKQLAEEVGKSIRVVEKSSDDRETIKGLLSPADIESINTVFRPSGQSQKIVVDEEYKNKINLSISEFEEFVEEITGTEYTLSFEEI